MKIKKQIWFEVVLFISFAIFIGSIILNKSIGDMDELWNYNFANCVSKGLVPYKDFSMVQTPLLAIIVGICLKIFSNSLIVMRILAVILCSSIMLLIYKILNKLKVHKSINILATVALLFMLSNYFCLDYDFFALFLTLILIYLELSLDMNKKSSNLIIGIIAGLIFLTKQTIGAFVCFSIVAYKLIFEIYKYNKTKKKIDIKGILYRIVGGSIPIILFVVYLIANNAFYSFIDYAVLGITTFSNKIRYSYLLSSKEIIIKILAIYVPINFVLMLIYSLKNKDRKLFVILALSLSMFIVAFPISDNIHFLIGSVPSLIGSTYLLEKLLKKVYTEKLLFIKSFLKAFSYLVILYVLIMGVVNEYAYINTEKYYSKLKHYEGIPISKEFEDTIIYVDNYITSNNRKVYILNFDAAIYMIPIDIYNKNYDMLRKGNFGSRGDQGLINDIKDTNNAIFLVLNPELSKNWQHPTTVTDYVQQNLKNIGNIGNYEIYSK